MAADASQAAVPGSAWETVAELVTAMADVRAFPLPHNVAAEAVIAQSIVLGVLFAFGSEMSPASLELKAGNFGWMRCDHAWEWELSG